MENPLRAARARVRAGQCSRRAALQTADCGAAAARRARVYAPVLARSLAALLCWRASTVLLSSKVCVGCAEKRTVCTQVCMCTHGVRESIQNAQNAMGKKTPRAHNTQPRSSVGRTVTYKHQVRAAVSLEYKDRERDVVNTLALFRVRRTHTNAKTFSDCHPAGSSTFPSWLVRQIVSKLASHRSRAITDQHIVSKASVHFISPPRTNLPSHRLFSLA